MHQVSDQFDVPNTADSLDSDPALWEIAARFLLCALIFGVTDLAYEFLFQSHSYPNFLVSCAATFALCCLSVSAIARRETGRVKAWCMAIVSLCASWLSSVTRGATNRISVSELMTHVSAETWCSIAVFVAFLAVYSVTGSTDASPYNAHVAQANAFLHGHTYIDPAPRIIEHVDFQGHSYQLHPPLPAILLIPFVAIWGLQTNQTIFCLIGGALDAAIAWRLMGHIGLSSKSRCWMTVFFGAGTAIWFEAINGGSWDLTMIVAVGFTLAALSELFGQARPGVIGLLAGLAALARYDLALDFPIYIALIYLRRRNLRELVWLTPGFALAAIIYVTLDEIRYGNVFDVGLLLWMGARQQVFALKWFVNDFYTLMFAGPTHTEVFPYFHPNRRGMAITFTSPAFVLALRPSIKDPNTQLMLAGALLAMGPSLFYFSNGAAQFGARHFVHVYPFLLVLVAMGVPRTGVDQLTKALIIISVVSISFWILHIRVWGL